MCFWFVIVLWIKCNNRKICILTGVKKYLLFAHWFHKDAALNGECNHCNGFYLMMLFTQIDSSAPFRPTTWSLAYFSLQILFSWKIHINDHGKCIPSYNRTSYSLYKIFKPFFLELNWSILFRHDFRKKIEWNFRNKILYYDILQFQKVMKQHFVKFKL
jgi:hypothetical protein